MSKQRLCLKPIATGLIAAALSGALAASASASATPWDFVTRSGSHLMLDGKVFRFSGANIEWLGLIGYGPLNFEPGQTERFPSHYEVNDALATAKEMGATVVRAQSLGDTVGCGNCLEPKLGQFNQRAFRVMDYAVMRARAYGIRLILEFQGDARAEHVGSTADIWSRWAGGANPWTDSTVIRDEQQGMAEIINHVNTYTGVAYKDDPTILGWMDCNGCQHDATPNTELGLAEHGEDAWVEATAGYVKSLDHHHLVLSNAALFFPDAAELADPNIDVYAEEIYPHWLPYGWGDPSSGAAPQPQAAAAETAAAGKAWMMSEFGWDRTDWQTPTALQGFLAGIENDSNVSGDLFWELEGHANGHGWEPLPANEECQAASMDTSPPTHPDPTAAGCANNEDGNWWAVYYTGLRTLSNTASDMAQRAQMLRTHAYRMRGLPVPPHDTPPAPIITRIRVRTVIFEGSAGAPDYSIQRYSRHHWHADCAHCVTDVTGRWTDQVARAACYRVIPYNLDGIAGPPSNRVGVRCPGRGRHPSAVQRGGSARGRPVHVGNRSPMNRRRSAAAA